MLKHQTVVYVAGTSFKMVSTLCQIWLTSFCQKAQNFVYFIEYNFVYISPACGPNTYQIMFGDVELSMSASVKAT